jgi:2-polyprenyl-3-methyl-5-hydroxy-6-metoxy-1,4-benzoquinol methylase
MCLITIESTNPKFSYIIYKNPNNGVLLRTVRQGYAYGFFQKNSTQKYCVYFQDTNGEISYKYSKHDEYDYLNILKYISPIFILNAIAEFFNSVTKKLDNDDRGHEHVFEINLVKISNQGKSIIKYFNKFASNYQINYTKKAYMSYHVVIKTKESLHNLMHFVNLLFTMISCTNEDYFEVNESLIEKGLQSINLLNMPYYIRYLMSSRIIHSQALFMKFKPLLETYKVNKLTMYYGNTAIQRRKQIEKLLTFDRNILDIGCGEGAYLLHFAKKIGDLMYFGIDTDKDVRKALTVKIKKGEIGNAILFNDLDSFLLSDHADLEFDIIITEVVEHLEVDKSKELILSVLNELKYNKIIITTPNYSFNKNYEMETKYRHEDHKWELTKEQFRGYIADIMKGVIDKPNLEFIDIGDKVDDDSVTQGVVLTKN